MAKLQYNTTNGDLSYWILWYVLTDLRHDHADLADSAIVTPVSYDLWLTASSSHSHNILCYFFAGGLAQGRDPYSHTRDRRNDDYRPGRLLLPLFYMVTS